ncbi:MAG: hypothetical protein OXU81_03930 [Gammaproteobacteria bacterium]|nr:hypothetical protein [Gammaproteobacteria bacterium]
MVQPCSRAIAACCASATNLFGTWFYQRKCDLLDFEIRRSGKHPATWEKKGANPYRAAHSRRNRQPRRTTNRLLGRIER